MDASRFTSHDDCGKLEFSGCMSEAPQKLRFGPGFFWLLIVAGWFAIVLGIRDQKASSMGVAFLCGLFSFIGFSANAWRWRRLTLAGRVALVLLTLPFALFCYVVWAFFLS
jgi:hypothetical protein